MYKNISLRDEKIKFAISTPPVEIINCRIIEKLNNKIKNERYAFI